MEDEKILSPNESDENGTSLNENDVYLDENDTSFEESAQEAEQEMQEPQTDGEVEQNEILQASSSVENQEKKEKLKKRRKVFKVLYIVMLAIAGFMTVVMSLVGLIMLSDGEIDWNYPPDIENVDDNFAINDFNDSNIVSQTDNFIAQKHKFITNGFEYSGVSYKYDKYDRNESYFKAEELNGIKTLSATYVADSYVILSIDSTTTSDPSKLKIVVTSEDEIIGTYDVNQRHYIRLEPERSETYFVKVIGEDADVEIIVNRVIVYPDEVPTI